MRNSAALPSPSRHTFLIPVRRAQIRDRPDARSPLHPTSRSLSLSPLCYRLPPGAEHALLRIGGVSADGTRHRATDHTSHEETSDCSVARPCGRHPRSAAGRRMTRSSSTVGTTSARADPPGDQGAPWAAPSSPERRLPPLPPRRGSAAPRGSRCQRCGCRAGSGRVRRTRR